MKKDSVKIVTIGGGSSYTPELIEGFIKRYDTLPVRELWLVDIEAGRDKLETVGALAKRMVVYIFSSSAFLHSKITYCIKDNKVLSPYFYR